MRDIFRRYQIKKASGVQHFCDTCDRICSKTGKYPNTCPGLDRYTKHSVRQRLKSELRAELQAES